MNWPKDCKVKSRYSLRNKATFKIGGSACFFSEPKDSAQLKALVQGARRNKLPVFILGAGSNLLISDKGVKGLVIKLSASYFKNIALENGYIRAGAGAGLAQLIKFSVDRAWQGLEFLIGIPGTVGGALAMNAGCWGSNIGDLVKEVEIMEQSGKIKTLKSKQIEFAYRKSSLAKYIILSGLFKLKKRKRLGIQEDIKKYLAARRASQDMAWPNAGCIFKNPENDSAGRLIELCGLKGKNIGNAFISEAHANFIINKGRASAKDVLRLMGIVKKQVKHKFNLNLQPEIKIWQ